MLRKSLTVLLAAGALTGCAGGVGITDAPERTIRAEMQRAPESTVQLVKADALEVAKTGANDLAKKATDDSAPEASDSVVVYAVSPEKAKLVDLEFSEGLAEPPQTQVVPASAPWAPSAAAEAGPKPIIEDVWPNKAPRTGGDTVVLRGRNLQAAQVVFGTTPAKIIEATEDKLTVVAPEAGVGEVAIVVTNHDGNYAVAGAHFQYYK